jgi:hypothetical protein
MKKYLILTKKTQKMIEKIIELKKEISLIKDFIEKANSPDQNFLLHAHEKTLEILESDLKFFFNPVFVLLKKQIHSDFNGEETFRFFINDGFLNIKGFANVEISQKLGIKSNDRDVPDDESELYISQINNIVINLLTFKGETYDDIADELENKFNN